MDQVQEDLLEKFVSEGHHVQESEGIRQNFTDGPWFVDGLVIG